MPWEPLRRIKPRPPGARALWPWDPDAGEGISRDVRPITDDERLSVVMTVKARTHHGRSELERIRQLLLPWLARFLDPDCVETHGRRWPWSRRAWERILLARPGWTEYSLYWLLLCNRFAVDDHYSIDHGGLYGNCVWRRASELDADRVRRMFEAPVAPFSVIQSNIEALRIEDVVRLLEAWIRAG